MLEDLHWADEATLDVLRLIGRRVEAVPALLLATYRDEALDHADPLRIVLGELATGYAIDRLALTPLSLAAVARLAEPHGIDAEELFRKTAGNPFFVTEALAAGTDEVPHVVLDAVLARVARVSPAARTVLEAVAVVRPHAELWLLDALVGDAVEYLDECLASGILVREAGAVAFRHEIARLAVEESLRASRTVALHRSALSALAAPPGGAPDLARLSHHAEAAGDAEAVLRFAPAAAARAGLLGAHREAAAQYGRALRFAGNVRPEDRAALLVARADECFMTYQFHEALEARRRALDCYREVGDVRKEGDTVRSLALLLWHIGSTVEADAAAREAVALLERLPPGRELASAYAVLSQLRLNAEDFETAAAWGTRAIELARRLDDIGAMVRARITLATAAWLGGAAQSQEELEEILELTRHERLDEQAGRAFANLAWVATRLRLHALADRHVEAGLRYLGDRGLALWCAVSPGDARTLPARSGALGRGRRHGHARPRRQPCGLFARPPARARRARSGAGAPRRGRRVAGARRGARARGTDR